MGNQLTQPTCGENQALGTLVKDQCYRSCAKRVVEGLFDQKLNIMNFPKAAEDRLDNSASFSLCLQRNSLNPALKHTKEEETNVRV